MDKQDDSFPNQDVYKLIKDAIAELEHPERKHQPSRTPSIYLNKEGNLEYCHRQEGWKTQSDDVDVVNKTIAKLYKAPEMFDKQADKSEEAIKAAHVWAIGMMVVKKCVGNPRYISSFDDTKEKERIIQEYILSIKKKNGPEIMGLVQGMMKLKNKDRTKLRDLKQKVEKKLPPESR